MIEKKCFIICPIGEEKSEIRKTADESLEYIIQPACANKGYYAVRADKLSDNGMITQSIIENILTSDLAIVDLTGRNPNVFYELAIRHSYGLPTILITRDELSSLPFDIHNVRTIQYDLSASGADRARAAIEGVIDSIENGGTVVNPVTSVSGILQLSTKSSSTDDTVLSELLLKVNSIPDSLDRLESNIGTRFSQMLTAFAETMKVGNVSMSEESVKNRMIERFFDTLLTNPQEGMMQVQNLIAAQKMIQDSGFAGGPNNRR